MVTLVASKEIWLPLLRTESSQNNKNRSESKRQTKHWSKSQSNIETITCVFAFIFSMRFWVLVMLCWPNIIIQGRSVLPFLQLHVIWLRELRKQFTTHQHQNCHKQPTSFTSTNKDITHLKNIGQLGHLPSFFGMNMKQVMYSKPPPPAVWRNPKQPPGMVLKPCK